MLGAHVAPQPFSTACSRIQFNYQSSILTTFPSMRKARRWAFNMNWLDRLCMFMSISHILARTSSKGYLQNGGTSKRPFLVLLSTKLCTDLCPWTNRSQSEDEIGTRIEQKKTFLTFETVFFPRPRACAITLSWPSTGRYIFFWTSKIQKLNICAAWTTIPTLKKRV